MNESNYNHLERNIKSRRVFACCFSTEGDLLSQWRAYSEDATGIAIGFDSKKMGFTNIIPKINRITQILTSCINKKLSLSLIKYINPEEFESYIDDIAQSAHQQTQKKPEHFICDRLHLSSFLIKNEAFTEEKECRILYETVGPIQGIKKNDDTEFAHISGHNYRCTRRGLSGYLILSFPYGSISQIVLGPKNESDELDILDFMNDYGFPIKGNQIRKSGATYRG